MTDFITVLSSYKSLLVKTAHNLEIKWILHLFQFTRAGKQKIMLQGMNT